MDRRMSRARYRSREFARKRLPRWKWRFVGYEREPYFVAAIVSVMLVKHDPDRIEDVKLVAQVGAVL